MHVYNDPQKNDNVEEIYERLIENLESQSVFKCVDDWNLEISYH